MTVDDAPNLVNLDRAVTGLLAAEPRPTSERIRELIAQCRQAPIFSVSDSDAELLAKSLEMRHSVIMGLGNGIVSKGHKPWLQAAKADIDPYFWDRYAQHLAGTGWARPVIASLDATTDSVLASLGNPLLEEIWDRRGMVVGNVQSGKTAHYIGLTCKAADAGYKLIVIIAGIHNKLRNQTQRRVDEGFVGRDSTNLGTGRPVLPTGVGRYDQKREPITFTTAIHDFSTTTATRVGVALRNLREPAVLVIKKNPKTLERLLEWLQGNNAGAGEIDFPLLVIDDEADNASINVSYSRAEISTINGYIRRLLKMFSRSGYVGYTATPFANIFIDPDTTTEMLGDDLFPRHFIRSLDPPSNYVGPTKMFRDGGSGGAVRHINDHHDTLPTTHKIGYVVDELPGSLVEAVRVFVLARALRIGRGDGTAHSSMLINVSRFTRVQRQIRNHVHDVLKRIQQSCRLYGALAPSEALVDAEVRALHEVWEKEFRDLDVSWGEIQRNLNSAASPIDVVEVNTGSSGSLDYDTNKEAGLHVIAVGGLSLSRGLTLEGLTVSYVLRNSQMYDTLLQMGRWFGYRPGFEDLCRVYLTEEVEAWYTHIAEATEDLRDELRTMEADGATPEDFGLKVRAHPETLMVTARNKLGSSTSMTMEVGLGNSFIETAILRRERGVLEANRDAAARLIASLSEVVGQPGEDDVVTGGILMRDVPVDLVQAFLVGFKNHDASILTATQPVLGYVAVRAGDELARWDVLIAGTRADPKRLRTPVTGMDLGCQMRTVGGKSDPSTLRVTNKQRVASRGIERTGVAEASAREAERAYRDAHPESANKSGEFNYPDRLYRPIRDRPLLMLHHLEMHEADGSLAVADPVVAWGISFPATAHPEKTVKYVVNRRCYIQNFGEDGDQMDDQLDDEVVDD